MDVHSHRFCSRIDLKSEKRPGRAGKLRCVPLIRQISRVKEDADKPWSPLMNRNHFSSHWSQAVVVWTFRTIQTSLIPMVIRLLNAFLLKHVLANNYRKKLLVQIVLFSDRACQQRWFFSSSSSHKVYSITTLRLFRFTHTWMCINSSYMW